MRRKTLERRRQRFSNPPVTQYAPSGCSQQQFGELLSRQSKSRFLTYTPIPTKRRGNGLPTSRTSRRDTNSDSNEDTRGERSLSGRGRGGQRASRLHRWGRYYVGFLLQTGDGLLTLALSHYGLRRLVLGLEYRVSVGNRQSTILHCTMPLLLILSLIIF